MNIRRDNIYIYLWEEFNTIYVGRTVSPKKRDWSHRNRASETTYKFSSEHHVEHPKMIIIENDLTTEEGLERERHWINEYRENSNYNVLNKTRGGEIGWISGLTEDEREERRKLSEQKRKNYLKKYKTIHREEILEKGKKYREKNKEQIAEYRKQNKEQIALIQKRYAEANKEKIASYHKDYSEQNKIKLSEYKKAWRETHKEELREKGKIYRDTHKDEIRLKKKEYRETHKKEIAAANKKYQENNKEKIAAYKKEYAETHKDELAKYKKSWYESKKMGDTGASMQPTYET